MNFITMMDSKHVPEEHVWILFVPPTLDSPGGGGGGMLKNAYFPQSHSRSGELETQGPRDLIVKIFQGETANVPF